MSPAPDPRPRRSDENPRQGKEPERAECTDQLTDYTEHEKEPARELWLLMNHPGRVLIFNDDGQVFAVTPREAKIANAKVRMTYREVCDHHELTFNSCAFRDGKATDKQLCDFGIWIVECGKYLRRKVRLGPIVGPA